MIEIGKKSVDEPRKLHHGWSFEHTLRAKILGSRDQTKNPEVVAVSAQRPALALSPSHY